LLRGAGEAIPGETARLGGGRGLVLSERGGPLPAESGGSERREDALRVRVPVARTPLDRRRVSRPDFAPRECWICGSAGGCHRHRPGKFRIAHQGGSPGGRREQRLAAAL